jgi:uncharacterized membrane protein YqjE
MQPHDKDRSWNEKLPANWREALVALLATRVALIELESKEAAKVAARRLMRLIVALACAGFMWALLLAGGIAYIAHATGWPWYGLAIGIGLLHLAATLGFLRATQTPVPTAFPFTRAEFQKDREWIENFQNPPKSNV